MPSRRSSRREIAKPDVVGGTVTVELKVHPKVIQQVLRHSDIRLTMDLYGELGQDDLFRELPGMFPVPRMFAASGGTTAQDRAS